MRAWSAVRRTPWDMLRVQTGDPSLPTTVTGPARLIALPLLGGAVGVVGFVVTGAASSAGVHGGSTSLAREVTHTTRTMLLTSVPWIPAIAPPEAAPSRTRTPHVWRSGEHPRSARGLFVDRALLLVRAW
jgi:hypothetical protein